MAIKVICLSDTIHTTCQLVDFIQAQLTLCYKILCHNDTLLIDFIYNIVESLLFESPNEDVAASNING